ncbi:hypothetical protein [Amycolatopsis sp. FDAARGOS 1241]|uniref:hypothetical protein n=1 Tax=Amycolatopsis sp. FDAARGOS 1241 TaxID=2778070 RepID=UPI001EF32739|nr:hypothetical protein [Amycolatopsis sp. FDAARGOS 1241]
MLTKPCGLPTTTGVRTLVAAIGPRDTAIGLGIVLAPDGAPLRTALSARIASDTADALVFGFGLPDRCARPTVVAAALGWAALCAVSAFTR